MSRLTTTTALERIDRQTLEWVAEPLNWPEQRARFQEVMNKYFAPDRIRNILALADLAPEIQKHLLAMTTTTVSLNVSEPKLRMVAQEPTSAASTRSFSPANSARPAST